MNRRDFTRSVAGVALGAASLAEPPRAGLCGLTGKSEPQEAGVPFKLSVMLWTVFKNLPFEERLEKVAEAGYRSVELVKEFEYWSEENFRRANAKKRALGMTFDASAGLIHGIVDPREREAFLADVRRMLTVLDKLECPSLIILTGNRVPGMTGEAQHQSCVEALKQAAEIVDGKSINLFLENIDLEENPRYYLWSAAEGFRIVEEVNHPHLKFLYDLYHEQISEGNLMEKLEKHINQVGLVHVADVPGRHEPGTGEINYANIFKMLGQLNYRRYVAMEFLPLGDPIRTLRAAREMTLRAGIRA